MKLHKYLSRTAVIIALSLSAILLSCDVFEDTSDYDVTIFIVCSGGAAQGFDATIILDGKTPIPLNGNEGELIFPAGKITAATISVTRDESDATLMILVYKDNELDEKGLALLDTCTSSSSTTYCSDTLSLQWEVDQKDTDKTSGTAAATSSSTTTSTTE